MWDRGGGGCGIEEVLGGGCGIEEVGRSTQWTSEHIREEKTPPPLGRRWRWCSPVAG